MDHNWETEFSMFSNQSRLPRFLYSKFPKLDANVGVTIYEE
jgi:hypothetical protein